MVSDAAGAMMQLWAQFGFSDRFYSMMEKAQGKIVGFPVLVDKSKQVQFMNICISLCVLQYFLSPPHQCSVLLSIGNVNTIQMVLSLAPIQSPAFNH